MNSYKHSRENVMSGTPNNVYLYQHAQAVVEYADELIAALAEAQTYLDEEPEELRVKINELLARSLS
jgi:hypothetical protein